MLKHETRSGSTPKGFSISTGLVLQCKNDHTQARKIATELSVHLTSVCGLLDSEPNGEAVPSLTRIMIRLGEQDSVVSIMSTCLGFPLDIIEECMSCLDVGKMSRNGR